MEFEEPFEAMIGDLRIPLGSFTLWMAAMHAAMNKPKKRKRKPVRTISELIKTLEKFKSRYGDLEVDLGATCDVRGINGYWGDELENINTVCALSSVRKRDGKCLLHSENFI